MVAHIQVCWALLLPIQGCNDALLAIGSFLRVVISAMALTLFDHFMIKLKSAAAYLLSHCM